MKILCFFLYLWVVFALLDPETQINADPDPAAQINADPDPATQINADPDPHPWI
jgi:hypothetical protein